MKVNFLIKKKTDSLSTSSWKISHAELCGSPFVNLDILGAVIIKELKRFREASEAKCLGGVVGYHVSLTH